jgi:hypothetical protein
VVVLAKWKAKSAKVIFRSALGQVLTFSITLQGESAGAQAFAILITYLAHFYTIMFKLTYNEVKPSVCKEFCL